MEKTRVKPVIILIHESWQSSLIKDLGSLAVGLVLMGTGWLIGSSAMQWVGALLFALYFFSWMTRGARDNTYSVEDARTRLDEIERGMLERRKVSS